VALCLRLVNTVNFFLLTILFILNPTDQV
jgi:hypothetical protein